MVLHFFFIHFLQQSPSSNLGQPALPDMRSTIAGPNGNLSLQQKQKMLADSENLKRMGNQPKLTPMSRSGTTTSLKKSSTKCTEVKDLTSSLMSANLNQMKHSQSFSAGSFSPMGNSSSLNQGTVF